MTSFEFDIDPKDVASAEFMTRVHRVLLREVLQAAKQKSINRAEISRLLGVDKSVITRALDGKSNLTIRTISDLCWALGVTPTFDACVEPEGFGCNNLSSDEVYSPKSGHHKAAPAKMIAWGAGNVTPKAKGKPSITNTMSEFTYGR